MALLRYLKRNIELAGRQNSKRTRYKIAAAEASDGATAAFVRGPRDDVIGVARGIVWRDSLSAAH